MQGMSSLINNKNSFGILWEEKNADGVVLHALSQYYCLCHDAPKHSSAVGVLLPPDCWVHEHVLEKSIRSSAVIRFIAVHTLDWFGLSMESLSVDYCWLAPLRLRVVACDRTLMHRWEIYCKDRRYHCRSLETAYDALCRLAWRRTGMSELSVLWVQGDEAIGLVMKAGYWIWGGYGAMASITAWWPESVGVEQDVLIIKERNALALGAALLNS